MLNVLQVLGKVQFCLSVLTSSGILNSCAIQQEVTNSIREQTTAGLERIPRQTSCNHTITYNRYNFIITIINYTINSGGLEMLLLDNSYTHARQILKLVILIKCIKTKNQQTCV